MAIIARDAVVGVYLQHLTLKLNLEVTWERSAIAEGEERVESSASRESGSRKSRGSGTLFPLLQQLFRVLLWSRQSPNTC